MITNSCLVDVDNNEIELSKDYEKATVTIGIYTFDVEVFEHYVYPHYTVQKPANGWKKDFTDKEKIKFRAMAETLAMLDGNAFFGNDAAGKEWYEMYLPEAYAIYEANGGDNGWAGESSINNKGL